MTSHVCSRCFHGIFHSIRLFNPQGMTESLVAGSAAALILALSQKIKYAGTILIALQGGVMSIVLGTELVSPMCHKSIYTWICALVLFVNYLLMNHEILDDNINGDVIDVSDLPKAVLNIIFFPFYMVRDFFMAIINTIRKCFMQIKRLFAAIGRLFHGKTKEEKSTENHYEQAHQKQEYHYRKEQTNREQAPHGQRNTSNISYFKDCSSRSELLKEYRKWFKELHPDNGGNPEDFIRTSNEYDRLKTRFAC